MIQAASEKSRGGPINYSDADQADLVPPDGVPLGADVISGGKLTEAAGLSVPWVYQIRDGRR